MTYASVGERKRPKDSVGHWALAGALSAVLVLCLADIRGWARVLAHDDLASSLGDLTGATLIPIVLIWAVAYFVFVRRSAPERGVPYLLILLAFGLLVHGAALVLLRNAAAEQNVQVRTARREIEAGLSVLAHPKSGAPRIDTRPKAGGDAGEAEHLVKVYMASLQDDQAAYKAEMTATGFAQSLKPEHIAGDRGLRATRANLAKAAAVVAKFQALEQQRRVDFRRSVTASALSPAAKQSMLAGFDRAVGERDPDEIWKLEAASLSEADAAVVVLQKAPGRWAVRGNKLVFADPVVLAAYNQHVTALHELARREATLRAEAEQKASAAFHGDGGRQ